VICLPAVVSLSRAKQIEIKLIFGLLLYLFVYFLIRLIFYNRLIQIYSQIKLAGDVHLMRPTSKHSPNHFYGYILQKRKFFFNMPAGHPLLE